MVSSSLKWVIVESLGKYKINHIKGITSCWISVLKCSVRLANIKEVNGRCNAGINLMNIGVIQNWLLVKTLRLTDPWFGVDLLISLKLKLISYKVDYNNPVRSSCNNISSVPETLLALYKEKAPYKDTCISTHTHTHTFASSKCSRTIKGLGCGSDGKGKLIGLRHPLL